MVPVAVMATLGAGGAVGLARVGVGLNAGDGVGVVVAVAVVLGEIDGTAVWVRLGVAVGRDAVAVGVAVRAGVGL